MESDDPWLKKRRQKEEEQKRKEDYGVSEQTGAIDSTKFLIGEAQKKTTPGAMGVNSERLLELIKKAEPMIEQVNTLYQQYINGVEKRPPIEKRSQLDQLINAIFMMAKPTPSLQFKSSTLLSHFNVYKERWEKLLKQKEGHK